MFKKMWLAHNIKKFCQIFGDEIGTRPNRIKSRWLKKLHGNITDMLEAPKHSYAVVFAIVIALILGICIGRYHTIYQAQLVEITDDSYYINFGNEVHQYIYEEVR